MSFKCCTLSNAFSKSIKHAVWRTSRHLAKRLFFQNVDLRVPMPFLNPTCSSLIISLHLLYILLWIIRRKSLIEWLIKVISPMSLKYLGFALFYTLLLFIGYLTAVLYAVKLLGQLLYVTIGKRFPIQNRTKNVAANITLTTSLNWLCHHCANLFGLQFLFVLYYFCYY